MVLEWIKKEADAAKENFIRYPIMVDFYDFYEYDFTHISIVRWHEQSVRKKVRMNKSILRKENENYPDVLMLLMVTLVNWEGPGSLNTGRIS